MGCRSRPELDPCVVNRPSEVDAGHAGPVVQHLAGRHVGLDTAHIVSYSRIALRWTKSAISSVKRNFSPVTVIRRNGIVSLAEKHLTSSPR